MCDKNVPTINDEKISAKKKDAERKRTSRALKESKKRSEMTQEELTLVRELDRKRAQRTRIHFTNEKREEIKKKDRERKRKPEERSDETKERTEKKKMSSLISRRKLRLLENKESKTLARQNAKEGMRVFRREGPIRDYKERKKTHKWAVRWKKYLIQNPKISELEEKKKTLRNLSN